MPIEIKRVERPIEWRCTKNYDVRAFDLVCSTRPNWHHYFTSKTEAVAYAREKAAGTGALFLVCDEEGYCESSLTL